jgi:hypothetical protein
MAGINGFTRADHAEAVPPQGTTHRIVLADTAAAARLQTRSPSPGGPNGPWLYSRASTETRPAEPPGMTLARPHDWPTRSARP